MGICIWELSGTWITHPTSFDLNNALEERDGPERRLTVEKEQYVLKASMIFSLGLRMTSACLPLLP